MPIIQMVGMLLNNTLLNFDISLNICIMLDFGIGNSLALAVLLYMCSIIFLFCKWHRIIIIANFINLVIAIVDKLYVIPIKDIQLLLSYYIVSSIFIIIAIYNHVKTNKKNNKRYECEIKDSQRFINRVDK